MAGPKLPNYNTEKTEALRSCGTSTTLESQLSHASLVSELSAQSLLGLPFGDSGMNTAMPRLKFWALSNFRLRDTEWGSQTLWNGAGTEWKSQTLWLRVPQGTQAQVEQFCHDFWIAQSHHSQVTCWTAQVAW
jgi:hypothetical protein